MIEKDGGWAFISHSHLDVAYVRNKLEKKASNL